MMHQFVTTLPNIVKYDFVCILNLLHHTYNSLILWKIDENITCTYPQGTPDVKPLIIDGQHFSSNKDDLVSFFQTTQSQLVASEVF